MLLNTYYFYLTVTFLPRFRAVLGLNPDYTIAEAGKGIRAGQKAAYRTLMASHKSEHQGKSPRELMRGEKHAHWLSLFGFDLFQRA